MIRLPNDMSTSDIAQWLGNGVFYVRPRGREPSYAFYEGTEGRRIQARLFNGEHITVTPRLCYVTWPELGAFNKTGAKYAFHASRLARRQYRRTINPRCVRIVVPFLFRLCRSTGLPASVFAEFEQCIRSIVEPKYPANWDELDRWIEDEGWHSVALNRRLIVAGSPHVDKRMLYLDGTLTATVIGGALIPVAPRGSRAFDTVFTMTGGRFHE